MVKSFDQILKDGKDKARDPIDGSKKWREQINLLMEVLHSINGMYGTKSEHQVKIKTTNCDECDAASFIIAARDLSHRERIIKFHRGKWLATNDGKYYCENCKKGK